MDLYEALTVALLSLEQSLERTPETEPLDRDELRRAIEALNRLQSELI
jgi:hypothetical protein